MASSTMTSLAGNFSFIKDSMWRVMCEEMYAAVTAADAWTAMKEDPGDGGFMFSGAPVVSKVSAHLNDTVGHSGSSFGITMRTMQRLARVGWDVWAAEQKASQDAEERKLAEACFAAADMDPYDKCSHGLPGYACMPCSH